MEAIPDPVPKNTEIPVEPITSFQQKGHEVRQPEELFDPLNPGAYPEVDEWFSEKEKAYERSRQEALARRFFEGGGRYTGIHRRLGSS